MFPYVTTAPYLCRQQSVNKALMDWRDGSVHKDKDLSSIPTTYVKMIGVMVPTNNSSALEVRQADLWASFISQFNLFGELEAKVQTVKDLGALSPEWNIFSTPLPSRLSDLCGRGGRRV